MKITSIITTSMLVALGTAHAATLATYDLSGTLVAGDTNSATAITGLTVGTLTNTGGFVNTNANYSGYTKTGTDFTLPATNWWFDANDKGATESGYIEFTVTVANGYRIDDLTVFADMGVAKQNVSSPTGYDMRLRSSADSYTANLGDTLSISAFPGSFAGNQYFGAANDTDSIGSQSAGAVTYRLYITDTSGSGNTGKDMLLHNLNIEGSVVAVPEPSSAALLGLAGLGLLIRRRR